MELKVELHSYSIHSYIESREGMEQDLHHTFLEDSQILQYSLPLVKHKQTEELLTQTTYSSRCIENGFLTTFICDKLWSHCRTDTESLLLGVIFAILFTKIVFG